MLEGLMPLQQSPQAHNNHVNKGSARHRLRVNLKSVFCDTV